MRCKFCDKETVFGTSVCELHGGHRIRYGKQSPNYKHGGRTIEAMESRERLRALNDIGILCGFMHRKMRGRKPIKPLLYDLERFKQLFKG
tara:strand:+ start:1167 stop:1436 length:270 start_codon:yes stop_codon:yes gene_type:complete